MARAVVCCLMVLGALILPAGAVAGATVIPRDGSVAWSLSEAEAAVTGDVISRVDGAVAQVDRDAVTKAVAGTNIRVVMLPFVPLDDDARDAAGTQRSDLRSWADDQGYELITVEGLSIGFSIFNAVPSDMPGMSRPLAQHDVTYDVLFAISHILKKPEPPDPTAIPHVPADAALVSEVGDALATDGLYNAPDMARAQTRSTSWSTMGDHEVRAAFFPEIGLGQPLPDLLAPLHERFPDDIVVVAHGRWFEAAGPQPELLHSSILWTYGYYMRGVLGWEVQPSAIARLFVERVALLATGVTQDEAVPSAPADPVKSASARSPWLFGGVALLLVIGATVYMAFGQLRTRAEQAAKERAAATKRRRLGARLAVVAGQIVAIEPLVHDQRKGRGRPAEEDFAVALERYQVASDVLARDGSLSTAQRALKEAERRMERVSETVGVPLASGADAGADAGAGVTG